MPDIWLMFKRILRHFNWKTISIVSHSMGAQFSFMFTGTHPNIVDKMVSHILCVIALIYGQINFFLYNTSCVSKSFKQVAIDALSPVVLTKQETVNLIPKMTDDFLGFEEKVATGSRPTYTYDQIVQKLLTTHVGGMDAKSCEVLMTRGIEEHPPGSGKFRFTHDIRVHYMPIQGLSTRQVAYVMENFRYG